MSLVHLESDKSMQKLFGPQSGIGDQRIYLAEQPFVTIQGEGPNAGKNTIFIRFFGCNLANSCGVDWCDSGHSFYTNKEIEENRLEKPDRVTFLNVEQFFEVVFLNNHAEFNNVVFTGGEPLLWQITIAQILRLIRDQYTRTVSIEIETNGTVDIETDLVDWFRMVHFNISPKIHVAKKFNLIRQLNDLYESSEKYSKNEKFSHDDWIVKFVFDDKPDCEKNILELIERYNIPKDKVYLMPEGISREVQLSKMQKLAEYCINKGFNFSPRLHVIIWDIARGI